MAMVETVIVLPVLLLILFSIVEFGVLFGRWQTLSNAAREGARTAVVFRTGCNASSVESDVRDTVKNYAKSLGISLADGDIAVSGACGDSGTKSTVTVTFTHQFKVVAGLAPGLSPTLDLVASSIMRNEGTG